MGAVFVREVIIFIGLNLIIDGSKTTPGRFNLPYLCYKDTLRDYEQGSCCKKALHLLEYNAKRDKI